METLKRKQRKVSVRVIKIILHLAVKENIPTYQPKLFVTKKTL